MLSDNIDQRDFLIKERKRNSGLKSFSFALDNLNVLNFLGIPIEGKGLPFCFKINSSNETDKIYFPYVTSSEEIKLYFNEIIDNV